MAGVKPEFGQVYQWGRNGHVGRTVMYVGLTKNDDGEPDWFGFAFDHARPDYPQVSQHWFPLDYDDSDGYCWTKVEDE